MIKFENIETHGWEHAMRGMRNPLDSWNNGDTPVFEYSTEDTLTNVVVNPYRGDSYKKDEDYDGETVTVLATYHTIGPNDLDLAMRLSKAGSDHAKYLRMIVVYMDITAPRYFHHQLDTYKVGTVKNSCSTMHTIHKREFTEDDFACSHDVMEHVLSTLEELRCEYLIAKERGHEEEAREYWSNLTGLLPQSYIQKFTWMANYEVLKNIYHSRRNHKLQEWRDFCKLIEELPYSQLITLEEGERCVNK